MDWDLAKPWVNRVGILLEFLSFWFAAPEILGEERLRALERRVERGIRVLPSVIEFVSVAGVVAGVLVHVGALVDILPGSLGGLSTLEFQGFATGLWLGTVTSIVLLSSDSLVAGSKPRAIVDSLWVLFGLYQALGLAQSAWRARACVWLAGALLAGLALVLEVVVIVKQPCRASVWGAMAVVVTGAIVGLTWEGMRMGWGNRVLALGMATGPWYMVHERIFPPLLRTLADDKRIRQRSLAVGAVLFVVGFLLQIVATF
jgi:hypothetical protein